MAAIPGAAAGAGDTPIPGGPQMPQGPIPAPDVNGVPLGMAADVTIEEAKGYFAAMLDRLFPNDDPDSNVQKMCRIQKVLEFTQLPSSNMDTSRLKKNI